MTGPASKPSASPTVYYDGACPVCAREMQLYQRQAGAQGLEWVDASRCEPAALGAGLSRPAALARLHMRLGDGRLVSGAAAFTQLWSALPRWAWAGRLLGSQLALFFLEPAYTCFLFVRRIWRRA